MDAAVQTTRSGGSGRRFKALVLVGVPGLNAAAFIGAAAAGLHHGGLAGLLLALGMLTLEAFAYHRHLGRVGVDRRKRGTVMAMFITTGATVTLTYGALVAAYLIHLANCGYCD